MRRLLQPFGWDELAHLCLGIVWAAVLLVAAALATLAAPLIVFWPAPFLGAAVLFDLVAGFERQRFGVLLGQQVGRPELYLPDGLPPHERAQRLLADPGRRRDLGYTVVRAALALAEFGVLTLAIVLPAVTLVAAAALVWRPDQPLTPIKERGPDGVLIAVAASLAALLLVVPPLVRGLARLDSWVTRTLLGGQDAHELERRVGELVEARARTVSAADAERAKLERDLHDGAQQRLIALSVLLGQAESRLAGADIDDRTRELLHRARAETSGTIDELRTLTRGLRPPILEARGLDAALSAVASRLPMPVSIAVDLPARPDPTIEAMLYFTVTEALTNVAKHAPSAAADVRIRREGRVLRATVTDAGPGGADVSRGTGLRGIADRLSGVDGRLFLSSPPGGPTVLTVEVPCASS